MKKYIAPCVKSMLIEAESLMAVSGVNDAEGQNYQFSNQRQPSASSTIWGFDDEAE